MIVTLPVDGLRVPVWHFVQFGSLNPPVVELGGILESAESREANDSSTMRRTIDPYLTDIVTPERLFADPAVIMTSELPVTEGTTALIW